MEACRPVSWLAEDEAAEEGGGDTCWDEGDGCCSRGKVEEVVLVGDEVDLGAGVLEGGGEVVEVEIMRERDVCAVWGGGGAEEDFGDYKARCCGLLEWVG